LCTVDLLGAAGRTSDLLWRSADICGRTRTGGRIWTAGRTPGGRPAPAGAGGATRTRTRGGSPTSTQSRPRASRPTCSGARSASQGRTPTGTGGPTRATGGRSAWHRTGDRARRE
jgi:hypothetical protein